MTMEGLDDRLGIGGFADWSAQAVDAPRTGEPSRVDVRSGTMPSYGVWVSRDPGVREKHGPTLWSYTLQGYVRLAS